MTRRPFAALPQVDQYVAVEVMERARVALLRCVSRGEGVGLLIGPSGTGKTLLGLLLAAELGMQMRVVALPGGRFNSPRALYQALLYELGRPYRGLDESEARLALNDFLLRDDDCSSGVLVLVDDAQCVGLRLLEELRALTNLGRGGVPLMRLVLIGNRLLEEHLSHPKLESLSQRITARCYLEAMPRNETQQYIQTRVGFAGGNGPTLFPEATCTAVHRATDGVARLVNQVCDHALLLAAARGLTTIEPTLIEEAWADLQQLPTPWNEDSPKCTASSGVIEFGTLDDDQPFGTDAAGATAKEDLSRASSGRTIGIDSAAGQEGLPNSAWECSETSDEISGASWESEGGTQDVGPIRQPAHCSHADVGRLDDDLEDAALRAEQEVDRIEIYLREAEEQYQPAGPKPEVELVFDTAHQSLNEPFVCEEEIVDRYASRPHRPASGESTPIDAFGQPTTVPIRPRSADAVNDSVLIVEDGYGDRSPPPCRVRPVRRSELADLFTRLRRGR